MNAPLEPPVWLDREPQVLWGCTQPELSVILLAALAIACPLGLLFAWFGRVGSISLAYLAVPLTGVLSYALVRVGTLWLRLLKRGRPDHYYRLKSHLFLARHGLVRSRFIIYSGRWSLDRNRHELP